MVDSRSIFRVVLLDRIGIVCLRVSLELEGLFKVLIGTSKCLVLYFTDRVVLLVIVSS